MQNQERLHNLFEALAQEALKAPKDSPVQKIGDFYATAMDTQSIDALGAKPLTGDLNKIGVVKNIPGLVRLLADFAKKGSNPLFGAGVEIDLKNSEIYSFYIDQGGLSLPETEYYTRQGEDADKIRKEFIAHVKAMLTIRRQRTDAISHERRAPLVRLLYRLAMLDPAPAAEEQQALERDLGALDSLIEEMLTYAKLDRPELPLQRDELELGSWAEHHLGDWQALRPEKHLTLALPPIKMPWCGDHRLLTRAVENLIGNALRYAESEVTLSISRLQENYLLEVSDDGPGIDPALAHQIFEPFVRLDQSRDRRTGGTGLGLAIVRSIALHHGGDVALLPSGKGARFCLTLPVHLDTNRHQVLTEVPRSAS